MPSIVCVHHWEIETATGPTSEGVCILCGEFREDFRNSIERTTWTDKVSRKESTEVSKGRIEYFKSHEYTPYPHGPFNS